MTSNGDTFGPGSSRSAPEAARGACEIATGWVNPDGYVVKKIKGRQYRAHRLAWEQAHGPIPAGLHVLHRCDNPPCRNVEHLFLGTDADNTRDKVRKGRASRLRGEANGRSKLTVQQVSEVRALLGNLSMSEIGRRFGVDWTTIRSIRDGETWKGTAP